MDVGKIKELIRQVIDDPSISGVSSDETDRLLVEIIRVEKKHLYGINQTSAKHRQEEIQKLIEGKLSGRESGGG